MVHCAWFRRIEISGSARQCQQRHLRLSPPPQALPRPRHTSAWRPSRHFTRMVTPKTRREKRKHAIVVHVRSNRGVIWDNSRSPENVRFSNRPFRVKRFQTIRTLGVDVARGLVLLFGIGTKALVWGFLCQGVGQGGEAFLRRFLGSISKPVFSSRPAHR